VNPSSPSIQFLGAAGTVTGSMHLVRIAGRGVLLDCGLFQGLKALRLRNWGPPPRVSPDAVDAVVLSHAHIDHTGYLPLLARRGFRGPVYCTPGTADLLRILLPDSARLLEEETARANRHGYSKHHPALPLYTVADAQDALALLEPRPYGADVAVAPGAAVRYRRAGHILGAATVQLDLDGPGGARLVFSGDLGRWDRPILRDPELVPEADVLLLESTYGDRVHAAGVDEDLARIVQEGAARGGAILIPAFAVGRTQELLWRIRRLEDKGAIPTLPVYLDSPMAVEVTDVYARHPEDHDLEMATLRAGGGPLRTRQFHIARTPEESKALNRHPGPVVIIAGSGMATGGRILHHLAQRLPDPRTTVLLAGFQAAGTRGRSLLDGARTLRMFGRDVAVQARIECLDALSAHADRDELLRWLGGFTRPPRVTYLVHGEPAAAENLARTMRDRLGWQVRPAVDRETVALT
jgi:metallo-beta-lactamase family protein